MRIAQHQSLRKSQRGLAQVQVIEVGAVLGLIDAHIAPSVGVARRQVADGGRFGHESVAVEKRGHGAQRVDLDLALVANPRRKGPHRQLVGQAHFFSIHSGRNERALMQWCKVIMRVALLAHSGPHLTASPRRLGRHSMRRRQRVGDSERVLTM